MLSRCTGLRVSTGDLDVFIRPTPENATRLLAAVQAFGFPAPGLQPADVAAGSRILQMGVEPVQIHVMSAISGVSWDAASTDWVLARCGSHDSVPFIGRDAFIRNKRAAGRLKDLADIDALTPGEESDA